MHSIDKQFGPIDAANLDFFSLVAHCKIIRLSQSKAPTAVIRTAASEAHIGRIGLHRYDTGTSTTLSEPSQGTIFLNHL